MIEFFRENEGNIVFCFSVQQGIWQYFHTWRHGTAILILENIALSAPFWIEIVTCVILLEIEFNIPSNGLENIPGCIQKSWLKSIFGSTGTDCPMAYTFLTNLKFHNSQTTESLCVLWFRCHLVYLFMLQYLEPH